MVEDSLTCLSWYLPLGMCPSAIITCAT